MTITRLPRIIVSVLVGLLALTTLTACGGRDVAIVKLGETVTVPVNPDGKRSYDMSVDELEQLTTEQITDWDVSKPTGIDWSVEGQDVYLVRYSVVGTQGAEVKPADFVSSNWALANADEQEFRGDLVRLGSVDGNCEGLPEGESQGCQVIAVPAGEKITMVRFMGANDGYTRGQTIGKDEWAGWTIKVE